MKRAEPGQVRVHRGFMRAGGSWELWPVEEVGSSVAPIGGQQDSLGGDPRLTVVPPGSVNCSHRFSD